ncbi:MAG TPA: RNA polymerase sigma factor [Candidatus Paceibacterota bacterium]|jgi:RNA polymerase sigma-70 factor (ECF subfamily)|nr:RNA polymerase sigma factor [Candidatus Paceibacterota bacterium]
MEDRQQEFREAFEKHSDELFRHASLRLSNRERALEITQETFLKAWEFLGRGEVIREYRPFLFRTLNNLVIDEYRKKKSTSLDAMMEDQETATLVEGHLLRDETDIFEEAATQYDAKRVLEVVEDLPENYRTVIVLRYVDGFSPSEIAEHIGETENAVSVRLHRGMRKLRDLLASSPIETP